MRSALRARADRGSASVHVISVLVLLHVCGRDGARALAGQRSLPSTEGCTARAIGREELGSGRGGERAAARLPRWSCAYSTPASVYGAGMRGASWGQDTCSSESQ